jgi:putative membrane protein insertion efficiency factor
VGASQAAVQFPQNRIFNSNHKGLVLSDNGNNGKVSLPALLLLGLYRLYKIFLSPLIGNQCRYLPTCSDYAADCVRKHGAWKGAWMGFARVCRCHPKGGHGFDPAPETAPEAEWYKPWDYGDWDNRFRDPKDWHPKEFENKTKSLQEEKNTEKQ